VLDARWVWMRQKQIIFRDASARAILSEIRLPPGRNGLVWGADAYAAEFVRAALERRAHLAVIASRSREAAGIAELVRMGIADSDVIDRDRLTLPEDMPDPLTGDGKPNPAYATGFMDQARSLGKAVWSVLGARVSPDFVVERPDQSTLHFSTFLARDHEERDELACSWIVAKGSANLSILGSHMYRSGQAREVMRLLAEGKMVMERDDVEVASLGGLPEIQQKMLEGRMARPKGVALVQSKGAGRSIAECEEEYLGEAVRAAAPAAGRYLTVHRCDGIAIVTLQRPDALNALNEELLAQLGGVVEEIASNRTVDGRPVRGVLLRGHGRAFMAGADIGGFVGLSSDAIAGLAGRVIDVYSRLEQLPVPVVALVDGFALGGGNELAMSAHFRIVTENAVIGQPEIKLGIMPGYGGMQRLPRLVGPRRAAELVLNGEPVGGHEAVAMGLADAFSPAATAVRDAFGAVREMADGVRAVPRRRWDFLAESGEEALRELIGSQEATELLAAAAPDGAAAGDLRGARRFAARVALEALRAGYAKGFAAGLENDARLFGKVTSSPSGQHWVGRFLDKDPRQSSALTLLPPR
jgi:enoyl-CoA hydratase